MLFLVSIFTFWQLSSQKTICWAECVFQRQGDLTGLCPVDLDSSVIDSVGRQRWRVVGNPRHGDSLNNLSRRVAHVIMNL